MATHRRPPQPQPHPHPQGHGFVSIRKQLWKPPSIAKWGFQISMSDRKVVTISGVDKGSLAESSGFAVDDIVVSINGTDVANPQKPFDVVKALFACPFLDIVCCRKVRTSQSVQQPCLNLSAIMDETLNAHTSMTIQPKERTIASSLGNHSGRSLHSVERTSPSANQTQPGNRFPEIVYLDNPLQSTRETDVFTTQSSQMHGKTKMPEIIVLCDVDSPPAKRIKIKEEVASKGFGEADIGDEVIEVAAPYDELDLLARTEPKRFGDVNTHSAFSQRNVQDSYDDDHEDDDIIHVGGTATFAVSMPHARDACSRFRFSKSNKDPENENHCSNCYCYVCDVVVKECQRWHVHCHASYKTKAFKLCRVLRKTNATKYLSTLQDGSWKMRLAQFEDIILSPPTGTSYQFSHQANMATSDSLLRLILSGSLQLVHNILQDLRVSTMIELRGSSESVIGGIGSLLCAMIITLVSLKPQVERVDTFARPLLLHLAWILLDGSCAEALRKIIKEDFAGACFSRLQPFIKIFGDGLSGPAFAYLKSIYDCPASTVTRPTVYPYLVGLDERFRDIILKCLEADGRMNEAAALCDITNSKVRGLSYRLRSEDAVKAIVKFTGPTNDLLEACQSFYALMQPDMWLMCLVAVRTNLMHTEAVIPAALKAHLADTAITSTYARFNKEECLLGVPDELKTVIENDTPLSPQWPKHLKCPTGAQPLVCAALVGSALSYGSGRISNTILKDFLLLQEVRWTPVLLFASMIHTRPSISAASCSALANIFFSEYDSHLLIECGFDSRQIPDRLFRLWTWAPEPSSMLRSLHEPLTASGLKPLDTVAAKSLARLLVIEYEEDQQCDDRFPATEGCASESRLSLAIAVCWATIANEVWMKDTPTGLSDMMDMFKEEHVQKIAEHGAHKTGESYEGYLKDVTLLVKTTALMGQFFESREEAQRLRILSLVKQSCQYANPQLWSAWKARVRGTKMYRSLRAGNHGAVSYDILMGTYKSFLAVDPRRSFDALAKLPSEVLEGLTDDEVESLCITIAVAAPRCSSRLSAAFPLFEVAMQRNIDSGVAAAVTMLEQTFHDSMSLDMLLLLHRLMSEERWTAFKASLDCREMDIMNQSGSSRQRLVLDMILGKQNSTKSSLPLQTTVMGYILDHCKHPIELDRIMPLLAPSLANSEERTFLLGRIPKSLISMDGPASAELRVYMEANEKTLLTLEETLSSESSVPQVYGSLTAKQRWRRVIEWMHVAHKDSLVGHVDFISVACRQMPDTDLLFSSLDSAKSTVWTSAEPNVLTFLTAVCDVAVHCVARQEELLVWLGRTLITNFELHSIAHADARQRTPHARMPGSVRGLLNELVKKLPNINNSSVSTLSLESPYRLLLTLIASPSIELLQLVAVCKDELIQASLSSGVLPALLLDDVNPCVGVKACLSAGLNMLPDLFSFLRGLKLSQHHLALAIDTLCNSIQNPHPLQLGAPFSTNELIKAGGEWLMYMAAVLPKHRYEDAHFDYPESDAKILYCEEVRISFARLVTILRQFARDETQNSVELLDTLVSISPSKIAALEELNPSCSEIVFKAMQRGPSSSQAPSFAASCFVALCACDKIDLAVRMLTFEPTQETESSSADHFLSTTSTQSRTQTSTSTMWDQIGPYLRAPVALLIQAIRKGSKNTTTTLTPLIVKETSLRPRLFRETCVRELMLELSRSDAGGHALTKMLATGVECVTDPNPHTIKALCVTAISESWSGEMCISFAKACVWEALQEQGPALPIRQWIECVMTVAKKLCAEEGARLLGHLLRSTCPLENGRCAATNDVPTLQRRLQALGAVADELRVLPREVSRTLLCYSHELLAWTAEWAGAKSSEAVAALHEPLSVIIPRLWLLFLDAEEWDLTQGLRHYRPVNDLNSTRTLFNGALRVSPSQWAGAAICRGVELLAVVCSEGTVGIARREFAVKLLEVARHLLTGGSTPFMPSTSHSNTHMSISASHSPSTPSPFPLQSRVASPSPSSRGPSPRHNDTPSHDGFRLWRECLQHFRTLIRAKTGLVKRLKETGILK